MAINVLRGIAQQAVKSGINNAANSIRSGLMSAINGDLPSNVSSFALLQQTPNKHTTKNLRFPIDVEGPPGTGNQGHYIMFFVNKQQDATIRFGSPDKTYEGNKNIQKAMADQFTNNSGHLISGGPPNKTYLDNEAGRTAAKNAGMLNKEVSTTMLQRPATIRTDTAISLYMPPSVQVSYGAEYADQEIGSAASLASDAYQSVKQGSSTTAAATAAISKFGEEAKDSLIQQVLGAASMVPGMEGAMDVINMNRGFIKAPRMELMFRGIPKREFSYDFKMMPKSSEEAEMIQDIIMSFKTNMLPEMKGGNGARRQTIPSTFDIQYMYNGEENQYLNKISTCVLESMNVTYGGDRYKTYEGGVPVETAISLGFKELDLITAEKAYEGY